MVQISEEITKPAGLVFFDLDGTLLTSQGTVAESSIDAIKQLKQNNYLPIVATGRTVCEVTGIMQQAGISSAIAMNGQYVMYDYHTMYANAIDPLIIERLHHLATQQGYALAFYNHQQMRISESTPMVETLYRFLHDAKIPEVDAHFYLKQPVYMLLLISTEGEAWFADQFPELTFIRNTPYCVDVFNHGGSKAEGINHLIKGCHFDGIPMYAFGDGPNDMEMFQFVDYAIAMSNGNDALKASASYVTSSNDDDGISKALKQLRLIA